MTILAWYFVVVFFVGNTEAPVTYGPFTGYWGKATCEALVGAVEGRSTFGNDFGNEIRYVGRCFSMPINAE